MNPRIETLHQGSVMRLGNGNYGYECILVAHRPNNHFFGFSISEYQPRIPLVRQDRQKWQIAPTSTEPLDGWLSAVYGRLQPREIIALLMQSSFNYPAYIESIKAELAKNEVIRIALIP